jgi:glutaredoxin-like protein NrdH
MTTVYTKPECDRCDQTKKLLHRLHVPFTEIDVEQNPDSREFLEQLGFREMPVVDTGTERWSGFRYDKLKGLGRAVQK